MRVLSVLLFTITPQNLYEDLRKTAEAVQRQNSELREKLLRQVSLTEKEKREASSLRHRLMVESSMRSVCILSTFTSSFLPV